MKCELLEKCTFFTTMEANSQAGRVEKMKHIYCEGNVLLCARRRVAHAIGYPNVPSDLHPDQIHLVPKLIAAKPDAG